MTIFLSIKRIIKFLNGGNFFTVLLIYEIDNPLIQLGTCKFAMTFSETRL